MKLLISLVLLASCQTPDAARIARYVGRPDFPPPCVSNGDGTCFRDGELENTTNMLCGRGSEYDLVQDYIELKEKYEYLCRKYKKCK